MVEQDDGKDSVWMVWKDYWRRRGIVSKVGLAGLGVGRSQRLTGRRSIGQGSEGFGFVIVPGAAACKNSPRSAIEVPEGACDGCGSVEEVSNRALNRSAFFFFLLGVLK